MRFLLPLLLLATFSCEGYRVQPNLTLGYSEADVNSSAWSAPVAGQGRGDGNTYSAAVMFSYVPPTVYDETTLEVWRSLARTLAMEMKVQDPQPVVETAAETVPEGVTPEEVEGWVTQLIRLDWPQITLLVVALLVLGFLQWSGRISIPGLSRLQKAKPADKK